MYQELVIDVNISANAIMDVLYMVLIIAINVGKSFLKPRNIQNGSLADDYHVYACEWDEESITFYFDDVKISETKLNDPDMGDAFKQPHWIIMSFSLDSKGEHIAGETTPLPQSMYVDYVRVYKQK